jgi:type I restriction enzyme S subunit
MSERWPLPNSWVWTTTGEVAQIVGGATPPTGDVANYEGGEIAWLTPADLSGYTAKYISRGARNITHRGLSNCGARVMPAGAVLFSSRAPIGYVAIASNPMCTNQGFKSFVFAGGILPDYAYYYLQCARDLATELASGTTFLEISGAKAGLIPMPLAPVPEQQRIVAEIEKQLTRLDDALAALKRVQTNLKRYRGSVLKAACEGRLVPTEAELARKEGRSYESGEQLLACILRERRSKWEADQLAKMLAAGKPPKNDDWKQKYREPKTTDLANLPRLPPGWIWTRLEQLAWHSDYGTSEKCTYEPGGLPVLRIPNVVEGGISTDDLKFGTVSRSADPSAALNPADLLIIRTNGSRDLIGRSALVKVFFDHPHLHASYLIRFRLVPAVAPWVAAAWDSVVLRDQIEAMAATSAGQYNLNIDKLNTLAIPLPPCQDQDRTLAEVDRCLSNWGTVQSRLRLPLADRLRQAILRRAFSGNLVPQDPDDEPASVLLERIRAERAAKSVALTPARRGSARRRTAVRAVTHNRG